LPLEQLKERFPSGQTIRQMSKFGGSVPSDPVERAIYADAEAAYQVKVENKAAAGTVAVATGPTHDDKAVMSEQPGSAVGVQGSVAGPTLAAKSGGEDGAPGVIAGRGCWRRVV